MVIEIFKNIFKEAEKAGIEYAQACAFIENSLKFKVSGKQHDRIMQILGIRSSSLKKEIRTYIIQVERKQITQNDSNTNSVKN